MIYSSVGSGHPGKYSYEIPHEYLKWSGNLLGKIISVKRNHQSNLGFFFKQRFLPSHMLPLFQDNFIQGEATSSHFFRVTVSTQQLLFWGCYFFRTAAVFSFFRTVTFSQELFFQNSFFFEQPLLENRRFFTAVTFRNSYFFGRTIQDKDI